MFCLQDRSSGGVTGEKIHFAKDYKEIKKFEEAVEDLKPTAIIGINMSAYILEEKTPKMGNLKMYTSCFIRCCSDR